MSSTDNLTPKLNEMNINELRTAYLSTESQLQKALAEADSKNNILQRQLGEAQQQLNTLKIAKQQSDKEHAEEREEWECSEKQSADFTQKAIRHIMLGDVQNWNSIASYLDFKDYHRLPGSSKRRQSIVTDHYDHPADTPHSDFGMLLLPNSDNYTEFPTAEANQRHLQWLDQAVMPRFFPAVDELSTFNNIMLAMTIDRLFSLLLDPSTDPLSVYWAASLLTQLACRWDTNEPRVLMSQVVQNWDALPLLQACGYLKLHMLARRAILREQQFDPARGQPIRDSQQLPSLGDRFRKNIEEKTQLCALNTIDFVREVCAENIINGEGTGNDGEALLILQRDNLTIMAVSHDGKPCYFLKDDTGVRFTQTPVTVVDYSIATKSGYAFWPAEMAEGYRFLFNDGDKLHAFLKQFAMKELNQSIRQTRNEIPEEIQAGAT